jgi:transcriptional regulator with XRE-family HTH domain
MVSKVSDKKYMISLSLDKEKRQKIENATAFMSSFYSKIPLKIRCLVIQNNWDKTSFPLCQCGNPVGYDKAYNNSFNEFCSSECARKSSKLPIQILNIMTKEWLYEKRISQKLSYENIAEELGISHVAVKLACKKYELPIVKYNTSDFLVQEKILDKNYLVKEYESGKTIQQIADIIGSSKATLSKVFIAHKIDAKRPNSYHRKINKRSVQEIELEKYINSLGIKTEHSNRTILNGKEIDIYCPELKIGFEYNGVYSHSEFAGKCRTYHLDKTIEAEQNGVKLFHIFSDNWILRQEITKSVIASKLGTLSRKIYARNCVIYQPLKHEKSSFLFNNHIQGNDKSKVEISLKSGGEIVAVMTFCKSRYNKKYDWELSRFACKTNTNIIGGFSKLLSWFRKTNSGSIISYADRTISFGDVYAKNGFELVKINPPGYRYVSDRSIKRLHRANFMKAKISSVDDTRSESEIMKANGYHKVWDCGTLSYGLP